MKKRSRWPGPIIILSVVISALCHHHLIILVMIVTIEIIVTTSANILLIRNGEGSCHQEKVGEEKWPAAGPALLFHIINILIILPFSLTT